MDQYLYIPFLAGWTSINPSYFDVNYRGTIGFDTLPSDKNSWLPWLKTHIHLVDGCWILHWSQACPMDFPMIFHRFPIISYDFPSFSHHFLWFFHLFPLNFAPFSSRIRLILRGAAAPPGRCGVARTAHKKRGLRGTTVKGDMDSMDLHQKSDQYMKNWKLLGGLEHEFYFYIYWE